MDNPLCPDGFFDDRFSRIVWPWYNGAYASANFSSGADCSLSWGLYAIPGVPIVATSLLNLAFALKYIRAYKRRVSTDPKRTAQKIRRLYFVAMTMLYTVVAQCALPFTSFNGVLDNGSPTISCFVLVTVLIVLVDRLVTPTFRSVLRLSCRALNISRQERINVLFKGDLLIDVCRRVVRALSPAGLAISSALAVSPMISSVRGFEVTPDYMVGLYAAYFITNSILLFAAWLVMTRTLNKLLVRAEASRRGAGVVRVSTGVANEKFDRALRRLALFTRVLHLWLVLSVVHVVFLFVPVVWYFIIFSTMLCNVAGLLSLIVLKVPEGEGEDGKAGTASPATTALST